MVVLGHWAVRSLMFQAADRIQMFFFRIRQFVLHRFQQLRQACSWGFFRCSTSSTVGRGGRAAHHKPRPSGPVGDVMCDRSKNRAKHSSYRLWWNY